MQFTGIIQDGRAFNGTSPIPWPPRPSPLFACSRNWYSFRKLNRVIIPELIISSEGIEVTNGCLLFSREFTTSIGNAAIYQKNKHNQSSTCGVNQTQQSQHSKDVWKQRVRRPILQALSSDSFPVASSVRNIEVGDEHSRLRQAAHCKAKIQLPEAIISSKDMDWDDLGCLKITGNTARRYIEEAVLWLPNSHPILKDYEALSALPSDDFVVDDEGRIDILRHLLKSGNRVWVTGTVHCQTQLDISKTEELDDARVAWFTVNHSHFLHQFCDGGITHAFWPEVGVPSIKKKLETLLAFCEMAEVFAQTHRTKAQRFVDSCVILSIFSNENARFHKDSMLVDVLLHLGSIQSGKQTESSEQNCGQKSHHEEFWQRLLLAFVQREAAKKTSGKARNENDALSFTEQSFQDEEQHSDFDNAEEMPVGEEKPIRKRPVVFLMEHRSTLPKGYVCSQRTMCSGCWENGGIPQSTKCAMRHLDYERVVKSSSMAGVSLVPTTPEAPSARRPKSTPAKIDTSRKSRSSGLQLNLSCLSRTVEECSDDKEIQVFYTPNSGSVADDHDSLSQYSLRSVSAYSQTTGGGSFSWIANAVSYASEEASVSDASFDASISPSESAAREPDTRGLSEDPELATFDVSSDDNGVSEPVTPVNDNSTSETIASTTALSTNLEAMEAVSDLSFVKTKPNSASAAWQ